MRNVMWLLSLGLMGCIGVDPFDPEVGAPLSSRCDDVDSDPSVDVSFSQQLFPVIQARCGCHMPTNANPIGFEQTGLDLSSLDSARAGGNRSRGVSIIPGQPCASILIQKIGPAPPVGSRMPFNGPPFLSDGEIQIIADWIAEGALEN